jgi:hypothetical protein
MRGTTDTLLTTLRGRIRRLAGLDARRARLVGTADDLANDQAAQVLHFGRRCLHRPRFSTRAVAAAVETARKRFPDARPFYLLTDRNPPDSHEPLRRVDVADLDKLPTNADKVFILAFESDELMRRAVRAIHRLDRAYYFGADHLYPATRYLFSDAAALQTLRRCAADPDFAHFYLGDSENLIQGIAATRRLEGAYVEIGVYHGRSALVALEYMRAAGITRECHFLDTFEGFTYPEAGASQDALCLGTHTDTSMKEVGDRLSAYPRARLARCDVTRDPLPDSIRACALANIDVDMYEAVRAALRKLDPLMTPGGIMMIEDYGHTPLLPGAYVAASEFLETPPGRCYTPIYLRSGYLFLVRHAQSDTA